MADPSLQADRVEYTFLSKKLRSGGEHTHVQLDINPESHEGSQESTYRSSGCIGYGVNSCSDNDMTLGSYPLQPIYTSTPLQKDHLPQHTPRVSKLERSESKEGVLQDKIHSLMGAILMDIMRSNNVESLGGQVENDISTEDEVFEPSIKEDQVHRVLQADNFIEDLYEDESYREMQLEQLIEKNNEMDNQDGVDEPAELQVVHKKPTAYDQFWKPIQQENEFQTFNQSDQRSIDDNVVDYAEISSRSSLLAEQLSLGANHEKSPKPSIEPPNTPTRAQDDSCLESGLSPASRQSSDLAMEIEGKRARERASATTKSYSSLKPSRKKSGSRRKRSSRTKVSGKSRRRSARKKSRSKKRSKGSRKRPISKKSRGTQTRSRRTTSVTESSITKETEVAVEDDSDSIGLDSFQLYKDQVDTKPRSRFRVTQPEPIHIEKRARKGNQSNNTKTTGVKRRRSRKGAQGLVIVSLGLVEIYTRMLMPPKMRLAKNAVQDLAVLVEVFNSAIVIDSANIASKYDKRGVLKRIDKEHLRTAMKCDSDLDLLHHIIQKTTTYMPQHDKQ